MPSSTGSADRPATTELALDAIAEDAEAEIVLDQLGRRASPTLLNTIRRASGGNPLRITAAVDAVVRRRTDIDAGPKDRAATATPFVAHPTDDPIAGWLDSLPAELLGLAGDCAALLRSFTAAEAARIAMSRDDTGRVLDDGVTAGLLETDGRAYWFAHELYRELAYERVAPSKRAVLHGRCAAAIASDRSDDGAIERGHHLLLAAEPGPDQPGGAGRPSNAADREHLIAAGLAAFRSLRWSDAARFLAASLDDATTITPTDGTPTDDTPTDDATMPGDAEQARLRLTAGYANWLNHDHAAAVDLLGQAVRLAERANDDETVARALIVRYRIANTTDVAALRRMPDPSDAVRFLERSDDPRWKSLVSQVLAESAIGAGDLESGRRRSEEARALALEAGDAVALSLAAYAVGYADLVALQTERALSSIEEAVDHADRGPDWAIRAAMRAKIAFPLLGIGALDDADTASMRSVEFSRGGHEFSGQALGQATLAATSVLRGDFRFARRSYELGRAAARRSQYVAAELVLAPAGVLAALGQGDRAAAVAVIDDWPALPGAISGRLRQLVALGFGDRGTEPAAATAVDRRPRTLTEIGVGLVAMDTLLAIERADLDELEALVGSIERCRAGGMEFPFSYPVSLHRLSGDAFAALGDAVAAIECYTEAIDRCRRAGARAELAAACAGWADVEAHRRAGDGDLARRLAAEGADVARRLGLTDLTERCDALARRGTEMPDAVAARGSTFRVILMCDMVASTAISRRLGDRAYYHLVSTHHEIVRACIAGVGVEASEGGDSIMFSFDDARLAYLAAAEIHDRLAHAAAASGEPLATKVALAGGDPFYANGRPYGLALNRSARLGEIARPGQIVVDEAVATLLPPGFTVIDATTYDLRGIGPELISVIAPPAQLHPPH